MMVIKQKRGNGWGNFFYIFGSMRVGSRKTDELNL